MIFFSSPSDAPSRSRNRVVVVDLDVIVAAVVVRLQGKGQPGQPDDGAGGCLDDPVAVGAVRVVLHVDGAADHAVVVLDDAAAHGVRRGEVELEAAVLHRAVSGESEI